MAWMDAQVMMEQGREKELEEEEVGNENGNSYLPTCR